MSEPSSTRRILDAARRRAGLPARGAAASVTERRREKLLSDAEHALQLERIRETIAKGKRAGAGSSGWSSPSYGDGTPWSRAR